MKLGKLTEVEVRDLWRHEQYDFSEWLSKSENIEYLNDILGFTLVEIQKEVTVGTYRCDLLAKDETTGTKVLIENQLEQSNHDHLGKIITYASGLDATIIVWIVKEAREEHRSAIEWLNNHTDENIGFFLIELHAYRIGDSLPAPKFEVIEQPNDFIKTNKNSSTNTEESRRAVERKEFWTKFNEIIIEKGKPFNVRKATTDHWYDVAIGTSEAHIAINLVNKDHQIVLELYISNNKDLFDSLYQQKNEIEDKLKLTFDWDRLNGKKACRIKHIISGLDFDDHSNYDDLMTEIVDKATRMRDVFREYIS